MLFRCKGLFCLLIPAVSICFSACTLLPTLPGMPAGPQPGTIGFYDINSVPSRVETEDVEIRQLSNDGDVVFVYLIDNSMVALGEGSTSSSVKPNHLNEASSGARITLSAANQLVSYLTKLVAQYDDKEKRVCQYMDFKVLSTGEVKIDTEEKPEEFIVIRFQYVFNLTGPEFSENTFYYLGGKANTSPKVLKYEDINTLITNINKAHS